MTKDEALKRALRTEKDSVVAAFLASLRESGWTLAPVEATEALKGVLASLVAAVSLLGRGGKKAAPSDKMFEQMLKDYTASINKGRAALLAAQEDETYLTDKADNACDFVSGPNRPRNIYKDSMQEDESNG